MTVNGRSGLDVLVQTWCENGATFHGFWQTRISILGLIQLFVSEHPQLKHLIVKGDIIVNNANRNGWCAFRHPLLSCLTLFRLRQSSWRVRGRKRVCLDTPYFSVNLMARQLPPSSPQSHFQSRRSNLFYVMYSPVATQQLYLPEVAPPRMTLIPTMAWVFMNKSILLLRCANVFFRVSSPVSSWNLQWETGRRLGWRRKAQPWFLGRRVCVPVWYDRASGYGVWQWRPNSRERRRRF